MTEENPAAPPPRSDQDVWREQIGHAISAAWGDLDARRSELAALKDELKTLKGDVDDKAAECTELETQIRQYALDMKRVDDGTYTPRAKQQALPFDASAAPAAQEAHATASAAGRVETIADGTPLARLEAYGCKKGLLSALQSSQLSNERKLESIGDMLRAMQADDGWQYKVRGMGPERLNMLLDAITAWSLENPEPVADDGRVRQCNDLDCHAHASRGIFVDGPGRPVGGQCPVCGNARFWSLIDPTPEPAGGEDAKPEGETE
jgi:hypothetical protein